MREFAYPKEVTAVCPYCDKPKTGKMCEGRLLLTCSKELGGCDRTFVATIEYQVVATVAKIEGEE